MFYSLVRYCGGNTVNGWTFLSISIWFIGGIQMICLGIIGEYIGKMYSETKARPRFIISAPPFWEVFLLKVFIFIFLLL